MIAGNVVGPDDAFGRDDNALFVIDATGEQYYERDTKAALAERLVGRIAERLDHRQEALSGRAADRAAIL